eukprot:gb/GFBE01081253.1/.p1 GENE.gb/GFBE01081253.1/~~gb/GFBE01081253.1/.p1  ORF type:complete len:181 (+),score=32.55 gb/GFBE01081253.1/:1-543(+)
MTPSTKRSGRVTSAVRRIAKWFGHADAESSISPPGGHLQVPTPRSPCWAPPPPSSQQQVQHGSGMAADVAYAQMVAQAAGIVIPSPDDPHLPSSGSSARPRASRRTQTQKPAEVSRKKTPAEVAEDHERALEAWPFYMNADIVCKENIRARLNLPPLLGEGDEAPRPVIALPGETNHHLL